MRNVVVTDPPRADLGQVGKLGEYGVATVHEALGRSGFLGPRLRPVHLGPRIGGTAGTALCRPGGHPLGHPALGQGRAAPIPVAATASPSAAGRVAEPISTYLRATAARAPAFQPG